MGEGRGSTLLLYLNYEDFYPEVEIITSDQIQEFEAEKGVERNLSIRGNHIPVYINEEMGFRVIPEEEDDESFQEQNFIYESLRNVIDNMCKDCAPDVATWMQA